MANNAKQVMDMQPSKGITAAQSNEHLRQWTEKGWQNAISKGNYDPTREHLNFEITKGAKVSPVDKTRSIPERMAQNLRERGIQDPNNGLVEPRFRTVVNLIFGGSRERMHELAFGKQKVNLEHGADNSHITRCKDIEEWAKDVYTFVSGKYGEENIVAFVVHNDEMNPHVHCTLLPIQEGKFAYKQIFAGKDKYEFSERMKELHSDMAKVNERWGMKRGSSIATTGAKHRSTEEYRRELNEKCTALEEDLAKRQELLSELNGQIKQAETRVKGLGTMVSNLKKQYEGKRAELKEIRQKMLDKDGNEQWLLDEKERLGKELDGIQAQLDDKVAKLSKAEEELKNLKSVKDDAQKLTEKLKQEAQKYATAVQDGVNTAMLDSLLVMLSKEHQNLLATLTPDEQRIFDDTLLSDVAQRGAEIVHVATLLFLGFVNDATTFAEGHGGGGGGSDLKWNDDDDKDEASRRFRCLMHASHMMRPATGRKVRR